MSQTPPNTALAPACWVVPCYNEARRLDRGQLAALAGHAHVHLVDDGSTDSTAALLREIAAQIADVSWHAQARNGGKGEAVRAGLNWALAQGYSAVGYLDADFSSPATEALRLQALLAATPELAVVLGARVRLLGHEVHRQPLRHYLGRAFATAASLALSLHVYDTQCGAKLFRASPALADALSQPFVSRWIFDVELLGRLAGGSVRHAGVPESAFVEVPLHSWRDVAGSKVRGRHFARATVELAATFARLRAWRSGT